MSRTARRPEKVGAISRSAMAFLLGPVIILVFGIYLLPLILSAILSTFAWTAFSPNLRWVGLDNYLQLDRDGVLLPTVTRTLALALTSTAALIVIPLSLALGLERASRLNHGLRTAFFAPVILSALAVGFVFNALLGLHGTINGVLSALVGHPVEILWLANRDFSLYAISFVVLWRYGALLFVVFLAGLAAIPRDLLDAAKVDGAGAWKLFRHVKLPLLGPAMTFSVVLAFVTALSVYELPLILTGGGPGRTTQTLNYLVVGEFGEGRFGSAAALTTVLYGVIFLGCVVLVVRLRKREVQL